MIVRAAFGNHCGSANWLPRAAVVLLALPVAPASADVRRVTVSSEPAAASVYLLKGFKREKIGETPLEHSFLVRSPRSIVRLEIAKPGYVPKQLELGEGEARVSTTLTAISPFREAGSYSGRHPAQHCRRPRTRVGCPPGARPCWRSSRGARHPLPIFNGVRDAVFLVADLGNTAGQRQARDINALADGFAARAGWRQDTGVSRGGDPVFQDDAKRRRSVDGRHTA